MKFNRDKLYLRMPSESQRLCVCHSPWSAFRLLRHQPGSSSRTRYGSRWNSVREHSS